MLLNRVEPCRQNTAILKKLCGKDDGGEYIICEYPIDVLKNESSVGKTAEMEPRYQSHNSIPTVVISEEERQTGTCTLSHIAEALKHLHRSGVVVLENAVNVRHLDALNAVLAPKAPTAVAMPDQYFNFGIDTGNINQVPPLDGSLMFEDVWANPFVLSILAAILGPTPALHYANGNTAMQAQSRQPVHSDIDFPHPKFPFSFVVNIPLVDMTEHNGATEVWPGSHAATSFEDQVLTPSQGSGLPVRPILPALVEQRRDISPPVRACIRKGGVIIRDLRLWHAGMPNLTSTPRVMLAFVWHASWWRGKGVIRLPFNTQAKVEALQQGAVGCRIAAGWVDGELPPQVNGSEDTSLASSDATLSEIFV